MEPSLRVTDIPKASIAVWDSLVGFAIRVMVLLKAVPAWEPLIPAFAISPVATAISSME